MPEKAEEARDFFELLDTCPKLTQKERIILTLIYFYGYTSTEIAQKRGTSKQNINQIKKRALSKLKNCQ